MVVVDEEDEEDLFFVVADPRPKRAKRSCRRPSRHALNSRPRGDEAEVDDEETCPAAVDEPRV